MTRIRAISAKRAAQHPELLKQGSTIARSSSKPKARKPIKKKRRSKAERERIYGTPEYGVWLRSQRCAVCGVVGLTEMAHVKTGGMGRKADAELTVPLCGPYRVEGRLVVNGCHRLLHTIGVRSFEKAHGGVSLVALAEQTQSKFETWQATLAGAE